MISSLALGIDIGGTNTAFGLVDKRGHILAKGKIPTRGHDSLPDYINALKEGVFNIVGDDRRGDIVAAGVGAPNANFYTGEILDAPNLPWKGQVPLAKLVSEALNMKVTITNDANAAALGEMIYGAAKGMKNFIEVTLGTGLGSGFVANGELIYGHDGFAGELGHVIAVRDGRKCGCGHYGCLERYCSATGIVITAEEWLAQRGNDSASVLQKHKGHITAIHIQEAAEQGDELALEIFEYTGKILGQSLADAVAITSPEAIIFFGGLARAGDLIFKPTRRYMEQNLLSFFKNKIALLQSELPGDDAAILGASALVW